MVSLSFSRWEFVIRAFGREYFTPVYSSDIYACSAAAFFTTYDTLKKPIPTQPGWEAATPMMAASCGEMVSGHCSCLFRYTLSEGSGRGFSTRSDRSDQVAHANIYVRSPHRLTTLCTDDLCEGRSRGVLLRVQCDYYARGSSPHPKRTPVLIPPWIRFPLRQYSSHYMNG